MNEAFDKWRNDTITGTLDGLLDSIVKSAFAAGEASGMEHNAKLLDTLQEREVEIYRLREMLKESE